MRLSVSSLRVDNLDEYKAIAEYDSVIKKRIADSWNLEQEAILKTWAEKASGWAWLHDKSARRYNAITDRIMYPSILLSTISGGIGLSMHNKGSPHANMITIAIGFLNIASACLASLQKIMRSTEKSEMHIHMNKLFSSYCRKIVMELALQPCDRKDCLEFCKACRDEYDNLVNDSPEIPTSIIKEFQRTFNNVKNVPDIANGLVHFNDSDKRQPILSPHITEDSNVETVYTRGSFENNRDHTPHQTQWVNMLASIPSITTTRQQMPETPTSISTDTATS